MLKSEETVSCWFRNYGQYSSLGCVQSVVQHIPYFFSQPGKAVIFLPGFSFPPETAGRQEVTKERSSGPLGLGPRSPPDSRNSRSGAEPSGAERSRAARRPPHLRSRRELARSLARPRARPRHRPAPASRPRPAPSGPGPGRGARVSAADCTTGTLDGLSGEDRPVCHRERIAQGTRLEEARSHGWKLWCDG